MCWLKISDRRHCKAKAFEIDLQVLIPAVSKVVLAAFFIDPAYLASYREPRKRRPFNPLVPISSQPSPYLTAALLVHIIRISHLEVIFSFNGYVTFAAASTCSVS